MYDNKKTEFFSEEFWFGLLVISKKTLSKKTILTNLDHLANFHNRELYGRKKVERLWTTFWTWWRRWTWKSLNVHRTWQYWDETAQDVSIIVQGVWNSMKAGSRAMSLALRWNSAGCFHHSTGCLTLKNSVPYSASIARYDKSFLQSESSFTSI